MSSRSSGVVYAFELVQYTVTTSPCLCGVTRCRSRYPPLQGAWSKLAAEQLCYLYHANFGVPTVSVRYFTVYGPRQRPDMGFHRFLRATLLGEAITVYGDGEQTRDFTFVGDAVSETIAAATRGAAGRVYNIGGGSRVTVNEVLEMIGRVSGRQPVIQSEAAQKGDMRHTYADTSVARSGISGSFPTVSLWRRASQPSIQWLARHFVRHTKAGRSPRRGAWASAAAAACVTDGSRVVPGGTLEPDKFLFDKGNAALAAKKWLNAREYFKQVVETYTGSTYRPDAKLAIGDTYLGEGTAEALVLAINEFTEFLSFYPTNKRADYAQYKLGLAHFRQMRKPERDQTETREAISELRDIRGSGSPTSDLMPEVKTKLRGERAIRLKSESDYLVGYFYFRQRWYPGAIDRFQAVLKDDPEYTRRDAVFFNLAESYMRIKREAEALPYYERLVEQFQESEYLPGAQKRIAEVKATLAARAAAKS